MNETHTHIFSFQPASTGNKHHDTAIIELVRDALVSYTNRPTAIASIFNVQEINTPGGPTLVVVVELVARER